MIDSEWFMTSQDPPSSKWKKSEAAPSKEICDLSWEFVILLFSNTEISFSDASWSFPLEYPFLNLSVYHFNEILQFLWIRIINLRLMKTLTERAEQFSILHSFGSQCSSRAPQNLSVYFFHEILSILWTRSTKWSSAFSTVLDDNLLGGLPRWGSKCFHSPNLYFVSDGLLSFWYWTRRGQ